jgi:hypothetical protein
MKPSKIALALALAVGAASGTLASGSALAWGGHHHHGARLSLGFNFGFPAYYPAPYYYYPAPVYYSSPVVVQQAPTVYVERQDGPAAPAASQPAQSYWYYCADSRTYYPYVKECPGGWQRVNPTPPPG